MVQCPCDSGSYFDECCGPIIGGLPASTPEALMRSRFTAYARGELDHIERTHAREVREKYNRSATESTANSVDWTRLEIRGCDQGCEGDDTGTVEFVAHFKQEGQPMVHHERSNFRREDGLWVYVDGTMNPKGNPRRVEKVGRNQPCPCGSEKKYKKCCAA